MRTTLTLTITTLLLTTILEAQGAGSGRPGRRPLLPVAEEVALARSAAPASVSVGARILVFTDSGYVPAEPGSTDVTCLVSRSWPTSLEPECFDAEASATIMPMEIKRVELYHRGVAAAEVETQINAGLADGRFRLPSRPAVIYMMSAGQQLIGDDGQPAGNWKPHLMIHYPFLTNGAVGHHGEPDLAAGAVVDSGRPSANLMVVVPDFVPVTPTSKPR